MDNVNHPQHYANQGGVECIDFIEQVVLPYSGVVAADFANLIKYLWRFQYKNGYEDIEKAEWYATHALKILEKAKNNRGKYYNGEALSNIDWEIVSKGTSQVYQSLESDACNAFLVIINTITSNCLCVGNYEMFLSGANKIVESIAKIKAIYSSNNEKVEEIPTMLMINRLVQATDDVYEDCQLVMDNCDLSKFATIVTKEGKSILINMDYVTSIDVATVNTEINVLK